MTSAYAEGHWSRAQPQGQSPVLRSKIRPTGGYQMRYEYVRVSTIDQDNSLQISALRSSRCDRIIEEKKSAVKQRPQLDELLLSVQPGDEILVYKLDRLARSLRDLLRILEIVIGKGASLRSLTEPIDAHTAAGRMLLQILGAVAEFERSLIRERCIAGQLEAVKRGKLIGRPTEISLQDQNEIIQLVSDGFTQQAVADAYGVSQSRVAQFYRQAIGREPRWTGAVRKLWLEGNK